MPARWCSMVSDGGVDHQRHLAADQVLRRRRAAAVGHVRHRHARRLREQQAGEMRHGACTRGGVVGLGRIGLHPGQHRLQVARRRAGTGGDGEVEGARERDRGEVLHRVVAQVLVEPRMDHQRAAGREDQRVAVRRGALDLGQRQPAAGARLVVDDHVLPERDAHLVGEQARHHVGRAARREADQDAGRALLRQGEGRGKCSGGGQRCEMAAFHRRSPRVGCCCRGISAPARCRAARPARPGSARPGRP